MVSGDRRDDLADDVVLRRERRLSRARDEIIIGDSGRILDDHCPGVADLPDMQGQGPGIDAGDAGNSVAFQIVVDRSGRAGMAGRVGVLADDETGDPRLSRFVRIGMDAVVADQGIGHADDLTAE